VTGQISLSNLPELLVLVQRIQEKMVIYLDHVWLIRWARSKHYRDLFEEFDSDLFYWLEAVTAEVAIRTKQDVSDIKSSLDLLMQSDQQRRREYAADAGMWYLRTACDGDLMCMHIRV